ncbi:MAG: GFA family protein, partial [Alphaproteobacteria bacterium]
MSSTETFSAEGGCACGEVRYRITDRPLFVHGC